jgi:hypothetical protein
MEAEEMTTRYYSGLVEIKEADLPEASDLLKEGWELLAIKEVAEDHQTAIVYVMGRW